MAQFFNSCGTTHIISNEASVLAAGFHKVKSYTQGRRHLTFYIHPNGAILSRMTSPKRHPHHSLPSDERPGEPVLQEGIPIRQVD